GVVFLLFEAAGRGRAANTHPTPLFRLQHLLEFTRTQAGTIAPGGSLKEVDEGYADAMRDLTVVAQKLGISDIYAVRPDDTIYKNRMMAIRSSQPRLFK